jgi:hypothetical protein
VNIGLPRGDFSAIAIYPFKRANRCELWLVRHHGNCSGTVYEKMGGQMDVVPSDWVLRVLSWACYAVW